MFTTTDSLRTNGPTLDADLLFHVLTRLGLCLHLPIERTAMEGDLGAGREDELEPLLASARRCGILLKETRLEGVSELLTCVREGYPVVLARNDGSFVVCEHVVGRRIECTLVGGEAVETSLLRRSQLDSLIRESELRVLLAKPELECDALSDASHHHPLPLKRFFAFLRFDARDIGTVTVFALVAGVLALATPLAIESLVNVVSWQTYLQPLVILAVMLLVCLGLAGILKVLQTTVVEIIQRRQLVRIVGDLAHRFPRANQQALEGVYPRELANRLFDIMTIQKATATLLLDGVSIVLTTVLGLLLLAFYHPFLLSFDIALLTSMVAIIWFLGRGGIATAIEESIAKYKIVHWLQDVLANPTAFKINGGEQMAVDRSNRLASEYLEARTRQFRVVIRQVACAVGLQVVGSTTLLGLGGWLVMRGQLTLGQLVASELVVTVVVGAFAKAGKSLEKFYDLMAGIDKVGHLLDIPVDPRYEAAVVPDGPATVAWSDLRVDHAAGIVGAARIEAGRRVAIVGDDAIGKSRLAKCLAGLLPVDEGAIEVGGLDVQHAALSDAGRLVGYAGQPEIFHGSLRDNIDLGRSGIGQNAVREALQQVGLWERVRRLPRGLQTPLQSGGFPLARQEAIQLTLARALVGRPRLLVVDGILDELNSELREFILSTITGPGVPWTLLVVVNQPWGVERFDQQIVMNHSS